MASSPTAVATDDATALAEVPKRIIAAWAANDGDAFAEVFTEDGSLILPGDIYLTSREQIRSFMTAAYAGPYRGSRVTGTPIGIKPLGPGLALVITRGGVLAPGETELSDERAVRASWLLAKQGDTWLITAYQNTPISAS
ncbi:MAG: hypothetical protein JWQ95_1974 [Sphaerisporangium sp.]|nr:hypothetical protein [Sphaerisporangium sp.]